MLYRHGFLFALVAALVISGCAASYVPAPLPVHHPASSLAPEAPSPPPSQALTSEPHSPTPVAEEPLPNPHVGHNTMQGVY